MSVHGIRFGQKSLFDNFPTRRQEPDPFKRALAVRSITKTVGFYSGTGWDRFEDIHRHLQSEVEEFRQTVVNGEPKSRQMDELGDVLYIATHLGAFQGLNARQALHHASDKFKRRFRTMESLAAGRWPGRPMNTLAPEEWARLWKDAKARLKP